MAKKSKEIKFTKQEIESLNKVKSGFEEVQFSLGSLEIVRI